MSQTLMSVVHCKPH